MAVRRTNRVRQARRGGELSPGLQARRLSSEEREMRDIWKKALSNPKGVEKQQIFRELTESTMPFDPRQRQFARDELGPDTRTRKMELASNRNPQIAALFSQLYPQDRYFKALFAGLK